MLDVHVPQPTHTWKDFFIHIATIVIGLLIAIGLEQLVERVHQHYELLEMREALSREFEANRAHLVSDEGDWQTTTMYLKNNLLVLDYIRRHPGTSQAELPGDLRWNEHPFIYDHLVWDAAEKNGIARRMPSPEANRDQYLYAILGGLANESSAGWNAITDARSFDLVDPDPTHLSPQRLDQVIDLTATALAKHIQFGDSFGFLAREFPELPHAITWEMIDKLRLGPFNLDPQAMVAAHQRTTDRVNAGLHALGSTPLTP